MRGMNAQQRRSCCEEHHHGVVQDCRVSGHGRRKDSKALTLQTTHLQSITVRCFFPASVDKHFRNKLQRGKQFQPGFQSE